MAHRSLACRVRLAALDRQRTLSAARVRMVLQSGGLGAVNVTVFRFYQSTYRRSAENQIPFSCHVWAVTRAEPWARGMLGVEVCGSVLAAARVNTARAR
ncbi:unnamed protein product [Lampetra fluviatilis]